MNTPASTSGAGTVSRGFRRWLPVVLLLTGYGCGGADVAALYRQGNTLYEQGKYAEAGRAYERILQQGVENGNVYYNLGNAYFKQQQIGRAIVAYERARRLMPRDPDIKANLDVANLRTVDRIQAPEPWFGASMLQAVTVNEATVATSLIAGLAAILAVGFILIPHPDTRRLILRIGMGVGVALLISTALTLLKIYDHANHREGIILAAASDVRSGPGSTYGALFTLHEGAKVEVVEARGIWLRVRLPDGKIGWIEQGALEVI